MPRSNPPARPVDPDLEPFLELAREIRRDVEAAVADGSADLTSVVEAIGRLPREERDRIALAVFDRLPPVEQWAAIERAYGDHEVRRLLEPLREAQLTRLRAEGDALAVAAVARSSGRLDASAVPAGARLVLGLFREHDVRGAIVRGHLSDSCARRVGFDAVGDGSFRVVEDVFNPRRGHFVTREYDDATWRTERLEPHALVRIGAISGDGLDPVLLPGARLDVWVDGGAPVRGRLHLGFVMLASTDVFAG